MIRESVPAWPDAKNRLHPTVKGAIVADIETLIGNPGMSKLVIDSAGQLAPLLTELVEAGAGEAVEEPATSANVARIR